MDMLEQPSVNSWQEALVITIILFVAGLVFTLAGGINILGIIFLGGSLLGGILFFILLSEEKKEKKRNQL